VTLCPVAEIAAVGLFNHELAELGAADPFGEFEGRRLVDPHQRRVQHEAPVHAESERQLHRLDGIVAAIGIARVIRLAHAGNEMLDAAPVGDRAGKGKENEIASRHEGGRQAVGGHFDLRVAGKRGLGNLAERVEIDDVILAEPLLPFRIECRELVADARPHRHLDAMTLTVFETDRLDARKACQRPCQRDGGILPAGKEHQGCF
jgi:hypothetical protein